jgi:hypothetical protein
VEIDLGHLRGLAPQDDTQELRSIVFTVKKSIKHAKVEDDDDDDDDAKEGQLYFSPGKRNYAEIDLVWKNGKIVGFDADIVVDEVTNDVLHKKMQQFQEAAWDDENVEVYGLAEAMYVPIGADGKSRLAGTIHGFDLAFTQYETGEEFRLSLFFEPKYRVTL